MPYKERGKIKDGMEHFIIPYKDDKYVIYFPLKGMISVVNKAFVKNMNHDIPKELFKIVSKQNGINITDNFDSAKYITIELTKACNLRCIYCYASGGDDPKYMDWKTAKAGIDYGIKHCKDPKFGINFYGGGEPLLAFPMMKRCYNYAKKKCDKKGIRLKPFCTTNGTLLDEEKAKWFKKNRFWVTISFDGTPELQNKQRPFRDGSKSYDAVKRGIDLLNKYDIKYLVSTCITKDSYKKMPGMVDYLKCLNVKLINTTPIIEEGRCKITGASTPDLKKYDEKIKIMKKFASKIDIKFEEESSFRDINKTDKIKTYDRYCGRMIVITADGNISSCTFVTDKNDPVSKIFFYGKIVNGKVIVDKKKLEYLRERTINNIPQCKDCFAKYYCLGGCPRETFESTGLIYNPSEKRCEISRKRFKNILVDIIE